MRIKAIHMSWFRGAADSVSMAPECKSMVVYGVNASGKSSFVDAIEFLLNEQRIGHLAHEYSGKHLKNSVPNTHKPKGANVESCLTFADDSDVKVVIKDDGSTTVSGSMASAIAAWPYRRIVLRQDEVVGFIRETKGEKYSALLPLFGLGEMEAAAENIRQVAKDVDSLSQIDRIKGQLNQIKLQRKAVFGNDTDDDILGKIAALHRKHCADKIATKSGLSLCSDITAALDREISQLAPDQNRHITLRSAADLPVRKWIDTVRTASSAVAVGVGPLIAEKLAVLQPTEVLVGKLPTDGETECPACGRLIPILEIREHVRLELENLRAVRKAFNDRITAMGNLCDTAKSLRSLLSKSEVKAWRDQIGATALAQCFSQLDGLNADDLRSLCGEDELKLIEENLLPLIDAAAAATQNDPPDVQKLLEEKRVVDTALEVFRAIDKNAEVVRAEALVLVLKFVQREIREEIKRRSLAVISEISEDIKRMWTVLHPGEAIEDIHLYLPKDADKAIDIGLRFHGKELDSPRLTLSEGYRNSLGLCIFLAMAKRETPLDRPVVLDDVVVSFDRNHRGMIAGLLLQEFAPRQVLIFTHDRDWYTELRQQLDQKFWVFRALLPYDTPKVGIRWSDKSGSFGDARAHIAERPDSAGNDARKVMDVELGIAAERLQIKFPYLRFEKNDRRMAHDFLERLIADGARCFQIRGSSGYVCHEEAIEGFKVADQLIVSWANRGSHSFDLVRPEAEKLIDACERALKYLKCDSCGKAAWFADAGGSEYVQCQCGALRWRYGRG